MHDMRLYTLVLYNLSPIQQWIQSWHAGVELWIEYDRLMQEHATEEMKKFTQWFAYKAPEYLIDQAVLGEYNERKHDHKTVIILNWWTSEDLKSHIKQLEDMNRIYSTFEEPDLGWITTAVSFIASPWDEVTKYFTPLFKLA